MIDKDSIRAAFAEIAEETPSPRRVQATLAARARRLRQRRLVLKVAGVGATAGVLGLSGLGLRELLRDARFPQVPGGVGGGWLDVPFGHGPTWLPGGHGLIGISVVVVADSAPVVSREWRPAGGDPLAPSVSLMAGWHDSLERNRPSGRREDVVINGTAGQLVRVDGHDVITHLVWQPSGAPQLMVTVHGDDEDAQRTVALRVANSVGPDSRHTWVGPRLGWLPTELVGLPWRHHLGYRHDSWVQTIMVGAEEPWLTVEFGPTAFDDLVDVNMFSPIQSGGLTGWQDPGGNRVCVWLDSATQAYLQRGRPLSAPPTSENTGPIQGEAALVEIASTFVAGPAPDMSWIGTR